MKNITIIDSCLRDGNHTINNNFTIEDIKSIVSSLDKGGIDIIEVGYGYGLASVDDSKAASDRDIIRAACNKASHSKIGILVFPSYAGLDDLRSILEEKLDLVRVAVQALDVEPAKDYLKLINDSNKRAGGFMMMSHKACVDDLVDGAKKLESYGASSITIVDSAGYMEIKEVREKISAVRKELSSNISLGFHCHDNLGLAVGNSLVAVEAGADFLDTALGGFGAGAGNTPTEYMVAALEKSGYKNKADLFSLLDSSEKLKNIVSKYNYDLKLLEDPLMIGYTGVYSTFMKIVKKVSKKLGLDYRILLKEVAKNGILPGQEDKIEILARKLVVK